MVIICVPIDYIGVGTWTLEGLSKEKYLKKKYIWYVLFVICKWSENDSNLATLLFDNPFRFKVGGVFLQFNHSYLLQTYKLICTSWFPFERPPSIHVSSPYNKWSFYSKIFQRYKSVRHLRVPLKCGWCWFSNMPITQL